MFTIDRFGDSCEGRCRRLLQIYKGCQREQLASSLSGPSGINHLQAGVNEINALSRAIKFLNTSQVIENMERERGVEPPYQAWESNVRLFIKD
jgi:hypothetical protein